MISLGSTWAQVEINFPVGWQIWLSIVLVAVIMALTTWSVDYFYIKVDAPAVRSKISIFGNTIVIMDLCFRGCYTL
jgi:hypothetical protein